MKVLILKNVNCHRLLPDEIKYLEGARVEVAITENMGLGELNTIIFMWDDKKYIEEKKCFEDELCPRPADRVSDVIKDLFDNYGPNKNANKKECEHLSNHLHHMNHGQVIKYDLMEYNFLA